MDNRIIFILIQFIYIFFLTLTVTIFTKSSQQAYSLIKNHFQISFFCFKMSSNQKSSETSANQTCTEEVTVPRLLKSWCKSEECKKIIEEKKRIDDGILFIYKCLNRYYIN